VTPNAPRIGHNASPTSTLSDPARYIVPTDMTQPSPLAHTLHRAVAHLRTALADPTAPVVVVVPSSANGVLARQQLALAGPFIRVDVRTPEQLAHDLGAPSLAARGLRPRPAGWSEATVGALVRQLAAEGRLGRFGDTLTSPGWSTALAQALDTLQTAGLDAQKLRETHIDGHTDRIELLATLMSARSEQLRADRLFTMPQLCAAARTSKRQPYAAAVVLGDRLLGPDVHGLLQHWLAQRPHALLRLPGSHHLPTASCSLQSAVADHAHRLDVPAARDDDAVDWVRTPDDVRELREATRQVLRCIDQGVALDQIAVVLPDAAQVDVLKAHLSRAGVPATFLVGTPLSGTPTARFLALLLTVATGDERLPTWYDLLRQPGLRLRTTVGPEAARTRGRWRRILARCGAVRGTDSLCGAVAAWRDAVDEEGPDPEGQRQAAEQLLNTLRSLTEVMASLNAPAPLGEHAQRWVELLRRWWVPSADREQLIEQLTGWGPPSLGPEVPLTVAASLLRDRLAATPVLHGSLSDPAVRVLTPMQLLGGAFAHVLVTGLTEGRFPRRPSEDPVLPDDVLTALSEQHGVPLLTSVQRSAFEDRRFAAVVGACTERLWLSAPATELLTARPLLPSSLLLDAASARLGRRARYADLHALLQPVGSRARPWADDPDDAIGTLERRVSVSARDPHAGLQPLAHHPFARRLLALHRALSSGERGPHTGLAPAARALMPALDGSAPLSPYEVSLLASDPGRFLVERVLRVRSLDPLEGSSGALDRRWCERRLRYAVLSVADAPADARDRILAAYDDDVAQWSAWRDDVSDGEVRTARELLLHALEQLAPSLPRGQRSPREGRLRDDLPFRVAAELGWVDGSCLVHLRYKAPVAKQGLRDVPDITAAAIVAGGIDTVDVLSPEGKVVRYDLASEATALCDRLAKVAALVADGWFPLTARRDVHLAADPTFAEVFE
jgi:hypothetical protein